MVVLWKTKIAKNKIKNTSSSSTDILRISWQSLHLHLMATLGRHVGTTFRCVSTTWLQWCSWRSLHYCSSRVIWCNNHWVRHRGFVSIIQGPQQHESQRHGKDRFHTDTSPSCRRWLGLESGPTSAAIRPLTNSERGLIVPVFISLLCNSHRPSFFKPVAAPRLTLRITRFCSKSRRLCEKWPHDATNNKRNLLLPGRVSRVNQLNALG